MKLIPEGKTYLIGILILLWVFLLAEYLIVPRWIKQQTNQRIISTYMSEAKMYREKSLWLDHLNKDPQWPKGWTITNKINEKGVNVLEAKGPISKRLWRQWLDELYTSPIAATVESCQLRRLSPTRIFVTIRMIR